jgi:TetR/AcrR family transcriptional regulator, copper-responsive repressor
MVQKEPKPRGRPRAYDPDVALARATERFWDGGYAATSLDELSAATGMNRPSLYGAFGDKRDLYLKALVRYWKLSRIAVEEALGYDRPLREALQRFYGTALSSYLSGKSGARGCFAIATATAEAVRDPQVRTALAQGFREIDTALEARIRFAQRQGELSPAVDPFALAMLASATLHTLALRARAGATRDALQAIVAATLDVICDLQAADRRLLRGKPRRSRHPD